MEESIAGHLPALKRCWWQSHDTSCCYFRKHNSHTEERAETQVLCKTKSLFPLAFCFFHSFPYTYHVVTGDSHQILTSAANCHTVHHNIIYIEAQFPVAIKVQVCDIWPVQDNQGLHFGFVFFLWQCFIEIVQP